MCPAIFYVMERSGVRCCCRYQEAFRSPSGRAVEQLESCLSIGQGRGRFGKSCLRFLSGGDEHFQVVIACFTHQKATSFLRFTFRRLQNPQKISHCTVTFNGVAQGFFPVNFVMIPAAIAASGEYIGLF